MADEKAAKIMWQIAEKTRCSDLHVHGSVGELYLMLNNRGRPCLGHYWIIGQSE